MGLSKELEKIEDDARIERLREAPHVLHPAGGLTLNFAYEPLGERKYVYRTKAGQKGITSVQIEFEDMKKQKQPHYSIIVEGEQLYFSRRIPREFLFNMPKIEAVEKWVKGEKQSLSTLQLYRLNSVYLRTFLDFPHEFEFSVSQLFVQQSWLSEILPVVFYLGIKGEFGGGKTVTGEAIAFICRHGYLTGNLSPPFVARSIQDQKLTLMVDELDTIAKTKDSDLNAIFRQGYRRGMKYSRVNPDTLETESYLIFGSKLFTVHSDIEEALQTRTIPIHVRETSKIEFPIVNLGKMAFAEQAYTENFLWYLDNILDLRDNEFHLLNGNDVFQVDIVDIVDLKNWGVNVENYDGKIEKIRKIIFENKKAPLKVGQLSQLSQLTGRNVELMYMCFILSNLTKTECDEDLVKTFKQKLIEEGERTEIGYVGVLRDVLTQLWKEKEASPEYMTENGFVKISNKEIYDVFNMKLKKEQGIGVSPATFKGYMLEFGFTDALNRSKQKVPIPSDSEPKSRLCNIFTKRVLRKLGVDNEAESSLREQLEQVKVWLMTNKDPEGLVDSEALAIKCKQLDLDVSKIVKILLEDYQIFRVPSMGKWGVK